MCIFQFSVCSFCTVFLHIYYSRFLCFFPLTAKRSPCHF
nr:MAG TPA: hypothetical protein [Caudoviricetes sp.]